MRGRTLFKNPVAFMLLACSSVIFAILTIHQYDQKKYYQHRTRELMIQNDSIISSMIELKTMLKENQKIPEK